MLMVYNRGVFLRSVHKLTYAYTSRNALLDRSSYPLYKTPKNLLHIPQVISKFGHLGHSPLPDPALETIESLGRIKGIRKSGKNLTFIDLVYNSQRIQVVINFKKFAHQASESDHEKIKLLRKGDTISVLGKPWRTQSGELSILASRPPGLLSACLHPPPGDDISEAIKRSNRVAQLKSFEEARNILMARDTIISAVSQFLKDREFLQVQTPILSSQLGGASAEPFVTTAGPALRVAPELWLKRLIIGGFERVYEIGSSFRNEGIDATHNPEFTTCEFYQTFTTLEELIELTKKMLVFISQQVKEHHPQYEVPSFNWKIVDFYTEIERQVGKTLPKTLDGGALLEYCNEAGLALQSKDTSPAKLLEALADEFIESKATEPTFLINPPALLAPLAKQTTASINGVDREISRRFELFIDGREYVNAYEEENDPAMQLEKLKMQAKTKNDEEVADIDYVRDMEWGLPPTGGWGMGIDRMVMLMTGSSRIDQVLAFGGVRQTPDQPQEEEDPTKVV